MKNVDEKRMFGGLGFMLNGNTPASIWKESLVVRFGIQGDDALLELHVRKFDITGKPMKSWFMVEREGSEDGEQLNQWIHRAVKFVEKLPGK